MRTVLASPNCNALSAGLAASLATLLPADTLVA